MGDEHCRFVSYLRYFCRQRRETQRMRVEGAVGASCSHSHVILCIACVALLSRQRHRSEKKKSLCGGGGRHRVGLDASGAPLYVSILSFSGINNRTWCGRVAADSRWGLGAFSCVATPAIT